MIRALAVLALLAGLSSLAACGAVDRLRGKEPSAKAEDPMARPVHVGTTSARAQYCGFVFNPANLRASYLAWEGQVRTPDQMPKVEKAYDYAYDRVYKAISDERNYCSKERVEMIRRDLNRYLAGDFTLPPSR